MLAMQSITRGASLRLFRRFAAAMALVSPGAIAACGSSTDTTGGGVDAGPDTYRNCGGEQTLPIAYRPCVDGGEPDASGADASTHDGGDAGEAGIDAAPPQLCFASCMPACQNEAQSGVIVRGFAASCTEDGPTDTGQAAATCRFVHPCGRRPAGLSSARAKASSAMGAHLAMSAWMEAASVTAFERMAAELAAHGAPRALVRAARRAASDEVRHARTMTKLARAHGVTPPTPRVRKREVRSLEAVARENAIEGCIRETYGALLATWQARHANDERVQRAMKTIARDERRHAALAMTVAAWIEPRLDGRAKLRLERAKERAIAALHAELSRDVDESLVGAAGLPRARTATRLHGALFS